MRSRKWHRARRCPCTISAAVAKKRGLHSMTAAIRVYLLNYFRDAATDAGHRKAGHGKVS